MNIISDNVKRIAGAQKRLGQNFILDMNITRKIVNFSDLDQESTVLEIGPGPGGLTLAILEKSPLKLIVIEKDERCLEGLELIKQTYSNSVQFDMVHGDALSVIKNILADLCGVIIIANLPYNIASPLLVGFVHQHKHIKKMILMFQQEVAQRIVGKVGTNHYGRLSIIVQAFFKPTIVYKLPPSAFTPPPKIHSAVVSFEPLVSGEDVNIKSLEEVTSLFFSHRRKTVGHIIKKYCQKQSSNIEEFLNPYLNLRPENLSVEVYTHLAQIFKK